MIFFRMICPFDLAASLKNVVLYLT
jgi:hypothetical protein